MVLPMKRMFALLLACALWGAPPPGTLVVAGGGTLVDEIVDTFLQAAGGREAVIGVLPAASGSPEEDYRAWGARVKKVGCRMVRLDVRVPAEAALPRILEAARQCTGFWFTGGDQRRISRLLVGTPLHQVVQMRLAEGAVVGGTSAGAMAMGPEMLTGDVRAEVCREFGLRPEDPDPWPTAPGSYLQAPGLGLLPGAFVDTHFIVRRRYARLLSMAMEHPGRLGLGLDERTALVVRNGQARVIGSGRVWIVDPAELTTRDGRFTQLRVHLLGRGQGLDLTTRAVLEAPLP